MAKTQQIVDKVLYDKIKKEAKKRFKSWPSAYASGWVVKTYKSVGGRYSGSKPTNGINRWFKEQWVNVCHLPKIVPCGRPKASPSNYPYCRPMKRVSKQTPRTVKELSNKTLNKRCKTKRSSPTTVVR